jgi:hypothetical protein
MWFLLCHDVLPSHKTQTKGPINHGLVHSKLWAKINIFSLQLNYLRYFMVVMESWLTQATTEISKDAGSPFLSVLVNTLDRCLGREWRAGHT